MKEQHRQQSGRIRANEKGRRGLPASELSQTLPASALHFGDGLQFSTPQAPGIIQLFSKLVFRVPYPKGKTGPYY